MNSSTINNQEISVTLALLDNDLQQILHYCKKHNWKFKMINSNNIQIFVPSDSLHLLFYLGREIFSRSCA
ncbi:hypothetical protein [Chryseobacterium sp. FDAARGOS 1104]|uniref:hypothetical protein n=1 Tax=Chryseobacterium sp. FDAARGOS 1104 TaxID=2778077 RepID=UPI00191DD851|nr:hypothetical protein [Chryseobacterium sp. FDAARGOS 1104]QQV03876.1 hypothetical protein I6I61_05940 [Chryseobacterium sp. FDAARGOS 1104]